MIANNLNHYFLELEMTSTTGDPPINLTSQLSHHGSRIRYSWDRVAN